MGYVVGYQQPVGAAIAIVVTFVLAALGSLVFARDVGGWTSELAERVAAQNQRAPYKYLLLTRTARAGATDAAQIRHALAVAGGVTFVVACGVLVLEAVVLVVNGVA